VLKAKHPVRPQASAADPLLYKRTA